MCAFTPGAITQPCQACAFPRSPQPMRHTAQPVALSATACQAKLLPSIALHKCTPLVAFLKKFGHAKKQEYLLDTNLAIFRTIYDCMRRAGAVLSRHGAFNVCVCTLPVVGVCWGGGAGSASNRPLASGRASELTWCSGSRPGQFRQRSCTQEWPLAR